MIIVVYRVPLIVVYKIVFCRRCTIRVGIFVLGVWEKGIKTNTAGTLPIIPRSGIGKGSRVRLIMVVVQSVTRFNITIRVDRTLMDVIVFRTPIIPANTAGYTTPVIGRTGIGKGMVNMPTMIVVQCVLITNE